MRSLLSGFLVGVFPVGLLPTAASSAQEPIPPTANMDSFIFGTKQGGNQGHTPKAKPPRNDTADPPESLPPPAPCFAWILEGGSPICNLPLSPAAGGVSPAQLASEAWERLPIPAPAVSTAPPRESAGLVGLPHWFWVTNGRPLSDRAQTGGVWVEVTASPQSLSIDPGDGQGPLRCPGMGTVYDSSRPATSQRSTCAHTYARSSADQRNGTYRVRVTVVWGGTWTGSGGTGGTLPTLSRSTSFPLRITEAQSLYTQR
jgi:hypothetical protein